MKSVIISDKDHQTPRFSQLREELMSYLKNFDIDEIAVGRGDLAFCAGCFGCWIKTPGECVLRDDITRINRAVMNSDAVFYLSPVVFGQFSASIKTVIDRGLPNMLPFFIIRPDGSTMHPPRYGQYPSSVFIGYGEEVSGEDAQLFADITQKHRRSCAAFVFNPALGLESQLKQITLERKEGLL
jgi:multimeric flavodoxin WrbA